MNCWRIQNLLAPFLDGELPAPEASAMAEHLEACPSCDALVQSVAALPDLDPPDLSSVCAGLLDSFEEQLQERIALSAGLGATFEADGLEESAAWGVPPALPAAAGASRPPTAWLLVAAAGLLLAFGGWGLHTQQRMDQLERSLAERDDLIRRLEQQVIAANSPFDASALTQVSPDAVPVFLPASAPASQTLPAGAFVPASYGLASIDRPRMVR